MEGSRLIAVVVGDLHLGKVWKANSTPATRQSLADAYYTPIAEAEEAYCSAHGGVLLSVGDFFDKAHNDEVTLLRAMQTLPLFRAILAGNHDVENRAGTLSSLQLLAELPGVEQIVAPPPEAFGQPYVKAVELCPEVAAFLVPHCPSQEVFEASLKLAAKQAAEDQKWPSKILITHCNYGSKEGKPSSDLYFTPALQAEMEEVFSFVFLGHEHLPARMGRTVITGSCQPCSFGELGPKFFWEVHLDVKSNRLTVKQAAIKSALTHRVLDLATGVTMPEDWQRVDLVSLKGTVPIDKAKDVQGLVKSLYAAGALAVKVGDVELDGGASVGKEKVGGAMLNIVEVVKEEISGNAAWSAMLAELLDSAKGIGAE